MSKRLQVVPDTIEGEPVVEVEEATEPLTPDELRAAQEQEADGAPETGGRPSAAPGTPQAVPTGGPRKDVQGNQPGSRYTRR